MAKSVIGQKWDEMAANLSEIARRAQIHHHRVWRIANNNAAFAKMSIHDGKKLAEASGLDFNWVAQCAFDVAEHLDATQPGWRRSSKQDAY